MKIIINTPSLNLSGGVASHYKGLSLFWKLNVDYNYIGSRNKIPGYVILPFDLIKFFFICFFKSYDLIVLNPSLGYRALKRDSLFLKITKLANKKTVIFWHGWLPEIAEKLNSESKWFKKKFNSASLHIVLSSQFKTDLINWGIDKPIKLTTTKVDQSLLNGFQLKKKKINPLRILFLGRIEKYKGIFIVLDTFKELLNDNLNVELSIVGDGSQLKLAKEFVLKNKLKNVRFHGELNGDELIEAYKDADIYILPSYSEGMPTTVLEAMAFGLPIISRPVGGLNDFFENGKMGYLLESFEASDYAKTIRSFIRNEKKINEISKFNHKFAFSNFLSSKVAENLEEIFKHV